MGTVCHRRTSGYAVALVALVTAGAIACSSSAPGASEGAQTGAGTDGSSGSAGSGESGSSGQGVTSGTGGVGAAGAGGTSGTGDTSDTGGIGGSIDAGPLDSGALPDAEPATDSAIAEPVDESCLAGITDYKAAGPFTFELTSWPAMNPVVARIPQLPEGCRVPIVHFANGTGASCSSYQGTLDHLASHGFLTLCYDNTNTGNGTQCIEAAELAYQTAGELVSQKVGFAGHHSGGQGAFMCAYRAEEAWGTSRRLATFAVAPTHGNGTASGPSWTEAYAQIESPILMLNTEGGLVSERWVGDALDHVPETTELYWYKAVGASDIPIPITWMSEASVPWFRWQLLGDRAACEYFKAMPDTADWDFRDATSPRHCE